ncbi:hypothetical protein [Micromonospora sp. NPDC004704]
MDAFEALFGTTEVDRLATAIAAELANRNRFAYIDYPELVSESPSSDRLVTDCNALHAEILPILSRFGSLQELSATSNLPEWLSSALFFGERDDGSFDLDVVVRHIGAGLVQQRAPGIDNHIDNLYDATLIKTLGLKVVDEENLLVNLSDDDRLELRNHGIVLDGHTLIYPHQFLRRFYGSNFVGIPSLLAEAKAAGASVSIRIDPLRKTTVDHYRDIFEHDYWYGRPFSEGLLKSKHLTARTAHRSKCKICLSDHCEIFTIFRTDMMDGDLRQFKVEEFCSLNERHGVGERYCVERFGHVVFDQVKGSFSHLDGAVRVFQAEEYIEYLDAVESGRDVDEKIGQRHKLFLVEGTLDRRLVQELLTEWFRYNPDIGEYFGELSQ